MIATPVFETFLSCRVGGGVLLCIGINETLYSNVSRIKANTATSRPKTPAMAAKVCILLPISIVKAG